WSGHRPRLLRPLPGRGADATSGDREWPVPVRSALPWPVRCRACDRLMVRSNWPRVRLADTRCKWAGMLSRRETCQSDTTLGQRPCASLDGAASCSSPMKPRISLLTLGVDDLERSLAFYRDGLGLPTEGIIGTEFERGAVAFFELSGGLKLALWERSNIAFDAQ